MGNEAPTHKCTKSAHYSTGFSGTRQRLGRKRQPDRRFGFDSLGAACKRKVKPLLVFTMTISLPSARTAIMNRIRLRYFTVGLKTRFTTVDFFEQTNKMTRAMAQI